MICLTGDLHHNSLGTGNQHHCDITEIQVAQRYLDMLKEAQVKVTFFVSGKSFLEEAPDLRSIYESELVEIGGHNWDCFEHTLFHRACNKILGSYNGPAWYQYQDVKRTQDIIRKHTGRTITAWRNHMYMHGPHTEHVLAKAGIKVCSDGVKKISRGPVWDSAGLYNMQLNVIPDHEHLFHAERTPEWVDNWVKRYHWSDDFGPKSYYVEEWTDLVLEQLRQNEANDTISTMIIHPITLYLCDRFKSFERILDALSRAETIHVCDATATIEGAKAITGEKAVA